MSELVKIPAASSEYVARFDRPYVGFIFDDRPKVFERIVTALLPFNYRLANTELVTTGTPADHKVIFRIPERGISFQFGAEEYRFGKEGSSWATAAEDTEVWSAAEAALLTESGAKIGSCSIALGMHLQLLSKTRDQVLAPFMPEPFKQLLIERQAQTFGCHMRFADGGDLLLDYSLLYANGIFLRLSSQFRGRPPGPDILAKVRSDQDKVFGMLGIQEAATATHD